MIKAVFTLVALASMRDKTLASHLNQHGFLFNVTVSKWKGKKGKRVKKEPFPIYRSWNGLSKYTTETQWKMTQAALALSGTVVLDRTHSKLESIFLSLHVLEEAVAEGRAGNGQAGGA